jgi:hypothetical protein
MIWSSFFLALLQRNGNPCTPQAVRREWPEVFPEKEKERDEKDREERRKRGREREREEGRKREEMKILISIYIEVKSHQSQTYFFRRRQLRLPSWSRLCAASSRR